MLLGLSERTEKTSTCRALRNAAQFPFGPPEQLKDQYEWMVQYGDHPIDVVHLVRRRYTGAVLVDTLPQHEADFLKQWEHWVFSNQEEWIDDSLMTEQVIRVHCSGLGGGLLSSENDYDIFLQNHAQQKVYGPSLAMVDDWERKLTQLGRTKSTHEYVMYQLLASMYGWAVWAKFLPQHLASASLLLTRAVKLLEIVTVRPAHSRPVHPTWTMALQQIMRCYHPQGKLFLLRAAFLAWDPLQVTHTSREVEILGFSAGSFTGLALHAILCEFECFPGLTKVAAIMVPPELMTLATGDRPVTLIHCLEDRLCVWKPQSISEVSFEVVLIEGNPKWSGKARHSYGHLLFAHLDVGTYTIQQLQTSHPEVVPHSLRCEGLLRVLSWVSFDLPQELKSRLSSLLHAAPQGCMALHEYSGEGRDVCDSPLATENALQNALIDMNPIPGRNLKMRPKIRHLLTGFLRGFSLRTLLFLWIWCSHSLTPITQAGTCTIRALG
jgi:hypothetical protein